MVKRREILTLCFITLFSHVSSMGDMTGSKKNQCKTTERDIYPCYHDLHCLKGEEVLAEFKECHKILTDDDMEMVCQKLNECCNYDIQTTDPMVLVEFFCPKDAKEKEDAFKKMKDELVQVMSDKCQDPGDEDCKRYTEILNCYADIIDCHKCEKKDCGEDVKN